MRAFLIVNLGLEKLLFEVKGWLKCFDDLQVFSRRLQKQNQTTTEERKHIQMSIFHAQLEIKKNSISFILQPVWLYIYVYIYIYIYLYNHNGRTNRLKNTNALSSERKRLFVLHKIHKLINDSTVHKISGRGFTQDKIIFILIKQHGTISTLIHTKPFHLPDIYSQSWG